MTNIKSSGELKEIARERSLDKYGTLIAADIIIALIHIILSFVVTISSSGSVLLYVFNEIIVLIISILLGVLVSGKAYLYMNLIYSQTVSLSDIFFGIKKNPEKAVKIQSLFVLVDFFAGLPATYLIYKVQRTPSATFVTGALLAILVELIVNIYVHLTYSQAFYLLHDFTDRSAKELLATRESLTEKYYLMDKQVEVDKGEVQTLLNFWRMLAQFGEK